MPPVVTALDHLVLTVANLDRTRQFYSGLLGMEDQSFTVADGSRRHSLTFGDQKINLHQSGAEFEPKAARPAPGSADLCFLTAHPLDDWIKHFAAHDVPVEAGPVPRTGATGPLVSVYVRDPDGNLIEISQRV